MDANSLAPWSVSTVQYFCCAAPRDLWHVTNLNTALITSFLNASFPQVKLGSRRRKFNRDMSWLIFATLPPCINYLRRCC